MATGAGEQPGDGGHFTDRMATESLGQRLGEHRRLPGLAEHVRHRPGLGERMAGGLDQAHCVHGGGLPFTPVWPWNRSVERPVRSRGCDGSRAHAADCRKAVDNPGAVDNQVTRSG
ncbi:hypothetical protein GCM10010442_59630 [Kitasatospora kifunensis]